MTDAALIRVLEEMSEVLQAGEPNNLCAHLVPSYNAALQVARKNHPEDAFLAALKPLQFTQSSTPSIEMLMMLEPEQQSQLLTVSENGPPTIVEMRALFGQLRIILESLQEA